MSEENVEVVRRFVPRGARAAGRAGHHIRARPSWIRYSDFNRDPPQIVKFNRGDLGLD